MIEVNDAVKFYEHKPVLNGISLKIRPCSITGLLGANRSGKSTLMKAITGLIRLDRGEILIDGNPPSPKTNRSIAYLPELETLYPWMSIANAMSYLKDFYADWDEKKAIDLLQSFELQPDIRLRALSKGELAKAKLLLALSRRARYLLLDEPLSGIDLHSRQQILQSLIDDFIDEEQTIVIATHEIEVVEPYLDELLLVRQGQLAVQGNLEELKESRGQTLTEIIMEMHL
ncbi:ABC transporter ATP-binding protein [Paenibacillus sp. GSMTC-2017]|uniref:ATP-binding cassette domain-containing protein n=1 Tax=Paenibacillus sp. GSMTC-2017 TaxID=2794350 RepID=UPI0018D8ECE5|nr:ABC transporter ATP-binding protein [Paenibacillus sp. GSMTC-2017]MBH5318461.1 ABC transporter ATP-binding protein [Paenibacillus sp. GSMTC-2017]